MEDMGFFDCRGRCADLKVLGNDRYMGCVGHCSQCSKGLHRFGWGDRALAGAWARGEAENVGCEGSRG